MIEAWNERQQKGMPMLFSPAIGAALKASTASAFCHLRIDSLPHSATHICGG